MKESLKLAVLAGAMIATLLVRADSNGVWIGGGATTDWSDSANWSGGGYPESKNKALFFRDGYQTMPALLTATQDVQCMYVQLEKHTDSLGNASLPDPLPVTLGPPMKLSLSPSTTIALNISPGRRLTLDGATVTDCGGIMAEGELILRNNASLTATNRQQECKLEVSGGRIVVDDSVFNLYALRSVNDDSLSIDVRNGGFFRFDALYGLTGLSPRMNVTVTDGTVWTPSGVYNTGLIPSRSGALVSRSATAVAFTPEVSAGDKIRWGGDVYVTNGVDAALSLTNRTSIYGGGRLFANAFSFKHAHATQKVELAEINLGKTINFSGWSHTACFEFSGRTRFGGFGNWRSSESADDYYWMIFRGETVFDTLDCFDETTRRTFWMKRMFFQPRASFSYVGGGSMTNHVEELPDVLAALSVGENTQAVFARLPSSRRLSVQKLNLAAGSVLSLPSIANAVNVCASATVDPSARISITLPDNLEDRLYPVYTSLGESVPVGSLDLGELPEGWVVKTVAGSAYLTNGKETYEQWDVWTGNSSGLWSDDGNWIVKPGPTASTRMARFHGETRTVVTNDVENVEVLRLRTESNSAPFVLTGNPIALTATGSGEYSTLYHNSRFPFIVDTPLTSKQNAFNVTAGIDAPAVLRGGVDAPQAKFSLVGAVVADSDITALQFGFLSTSAKKAVLTVRDGAEVAITGQSDPVTGSGVVWVENGGTMTVAGDLSFAQTKNEFRIDGLFDIAGTLSASVSHGFFGTGVVQVAETATDAGQSPLRIGEGVTLKAQSWGALPLEVVSSATLAADGDLTYAVSGGLSVSGLGAKFCLDTGDYDLTLSTMLTGYDFDVIKKGEGTLRLDCPNTLSGYVTVDDGTLFWQDDQVFGKLVARPGSTLKFGSRDGVVGKLVLGDSVDLSAVTLVAADEATRELAMRSKLPVISVGEFCEIKNLPTVPDGYELHLSENEDGGQTLSVKIKPGLVIFIK